MMKSKYLFTVIMAVYNVEAFLAESIESVISQDICFDNIQVILVDDGSTDSSGRICDEYAQQYPKNIQVLHKENGGVSSARNLGLEYAEGEYVNFLDSDDLLSKNAMGAVYKFFGEHSCEMDLVSIPMVFFDGKEGSHILNYKFLKGNRVIDLLKEWDAPQLSLSSAFVKREVISRYRFNEQLNYAEDAELVLRILQESFKLGVVSDATYWYRRRRDGAPSAIQGGSGRYNYYIPYITHFAESSLCACMEKYGQVPLFVQNTVAYDLQWRLLQRKIPNGVLTLDEEKEYYFKLIHCFEYIDRIVIMAQKNIWIEQKLFILKKKYRERIRQIRMNGDIVWLADGTEIYRLSRTTVKCEFLSIKNHECIFEARVFNYVPELGPLRFFVRYGGVNYPCKTENITENTGCLWEELMHQYRIEASFPLQSNGNMKVVCCLGKEEIELKSLTFGKYFPISNFYSRAYCNCGGYRITQKNSSIYIERTNARQRFIDELKFLKNLLKGSEKNDHAKKAAKKAIVIRPIVHLISLLKRHPIWLISDRVNRADDNGLAFFMYMREKHKEVKAYFVISKDCADYRQIRKLGPTLAADGILYKVLRLCSDFVISSMAEDIVFNPFQGHSEPYRDLLTNAKFVFLQHGVTKDDLSEWLNKYNKNIFGFITAAVPEHNSIVNGNYFYDERRVWLTGFARFDRLYDHHKKQIAIMPTWRKYLMSHYDAVAGRWMVAADFTESEYYRFFNGLLNDSRLLDAAKQYGYRIVFLPHPNLQGCVNLFSSPEDVELLDSTAVYRDVFADSSLVVSDYSSVVFDFAYLRKPIVYTHFDKKEFFAGDHSYSAGYFDYERDGFGEVEYSLDNTVERIIQYMQTGCQIKDKYRARIDNFFAFSDKNNCERIYQRIMESVQ